MIWVMEIEYVIFSRSVAGAVPQQQRFSNPRSSVSASTISAQCGH
ncbi:hypothetical protein CDPW8_0712 [Corynebacterium diphtheriae PW8]|nr:hypothetical protein CDPW8_0712 [Corynebacterium diphtheriae PW8]